MEQKTASIHPNIITTIHRLAEFFGTQIILKSIMDECNRKIRSKIQEKGYPNEKEVNEKNFETEFPYLSQLTCFESSRSAPIKDFKDDQFLLVFLENFICIIFPGSIANNDDKHNERLGIMSNLFFHALNILCDLSKMGLVMNFSPKENSILSQSKLTPVDGKKLNMGVMMDILSLKMIEYNEIFWKNTFSRYMIVNTTDSWKFMIERVDNAKVTSSKTQEISIPTIFLEDFSSSHDNGRKLCAYCYVYSYRVQKGANYLPAGTESHESYSYGYALIAAFFLNFLVHGDAIAIL